MLEKSLLSPADSVCYDLEDAVAPASKAEARRAVCELLDVSTPRSPLAHMPTESRSSLGTGIC